MQANTITEAARFITKGMRPRRRPAFDTEYRSLVERWRGDLEFREAVVAAAEGFGLYVLDDGVSAETGIVLGVRDDSVFAYNLSSIRRTLSQADAVALALVMVGMAAVFYPTSESLENRDRTLRMATLSRARDIIVQICEHLEADAKMNEEGDGCAYEDGWRALLNKNPFNDPKGIRQGADRAKPSTIEGLIRMVANLWEEQGLIAVQSTPSGERYVALERLRVMLAEFAAHPLLEIAMTAGRGVHSEGTAEEETPC